MGERQKRIFLSPVLSPDFWSQASGVHWMPRGCWVKVQFTGHGLCMPAPRPKLQYATGNPIRHTSVEERGLDVPWNPSVLDVGSTVFCRCKCDWFLARVI